MKVISHPVHIASRHISLEGDLNITRDSAGIILFVHGSGSSRFSPRNQRVAGILQENGLSTLLFDLLTREEEIVDSRTAQFRFDIPLLSRRLALATEWVGENAETRDLPLGYFGASTGAAAAIITAAEHPERVSAVVSRGGRPDLAGDFLKTLKTPILLIVGGNDTHVISLNQGAFETIRSGKEMLIVPKAGHLFEEPGALEKVAGLAAGFFKRHFTSGDVDRKS